MVNQNDRLIVDVVEGDVDQMIQSFENSFGGEANASGYCVNSPNLDINLHRTSLGIAIQMIIFDYHSKNDILIRRKHDDNPDLVHIMILMEGDYAQQIGDNYQTVGDSSNYGAFIYNGLIDMDIELKKDIQYNWIGFKIDIAKVGPFYQEIRTGIRELFPDREKGLYYHHPLTTDILRLSTDAVHFSQLPKFGDSLVGARGVEILIHLINGLMKAQAEDTFFMFHKADIERLNKIKNEITEDVTKKHSLESLASKYNMSPSKLKRDFKRCFGHPVMQFANISRMEEGYRRLQTGKYTVSEVGYDLGYSNLSKFTTMFKKIIGIMPSEVEVIE